MPLSVTVDDESRGGTTDIAKFRVRLAATLRKAYEHVRTSQRSMAEKNSLLKQANTYHKALVFECNKDEGEEELAITHLVKMSTQVNMYLKPSHVGVELTSTMSIARVCHASFTLHTTEGSPWFSCLGGFRT